MLSHSCLMQASSCSTVLGLLCRIFLFMMRQMFSMRKRLRFWIMFRYGFFLTYRVLAGNGEWHDGLCSPTMSSGSIPEPML